VAGGGRTNALTRRAGARSALITDTEEVARANRDDAAHVSEMMSPGGMISPTTGRLAGRQFLALSARGRQAARNVTGRASPPSYLLSSTNKQRELFGWVRQPCGKFFKSAPLILGIDGQFDLLPHHPDS